MLLLLFNGGGAPSGAINVRDIVGRILPSLHVADIERIEYWTEEELIGYASEGLRALAAKLCLFTERSTVTTVQDQALYSYPARHIHSIYSALDGTTLRPATVAELSALDDTWEDTAGDAERLVPDFRGLDQFALYPIPDTGGQTIDLIYCQAPDVVDVDSPQVAAPSILADYIFWLILREARRKESLAQMPEVAAHAGERLRLFEDVFKAYWG